MSKPQPSSDLTPEFKKRLHSALTSTYRRWDLLHEQFSSRRASDILREQLPHIPSESWNERIDWGGVFVNGQRLIADQEIELPCVVEYYEPKYKIASYHKAFPGITRNNIVYSDDYLIAIYKPAGLPTIEVKEQRHYHLRAIVEQWFGKPVHIPSRLDVSAQGLVLVSIAPEFHDKLQKLFERRRVQKAYRLLLSGEVLWSKTIVNSAIGRDPRHPVLRRPVRSGGKLALTEFSCKTSNTDHSLIEAKPVTGRTHQLRVHSSHLGHPIVGDRFYGGISAEELHLLSYRWQFQHPKTGREINIIVPDRLMPAWGKKAAPGKQEAVAYPGA